LTEYGIDLDEELGEGRFGWLLDRILDLPDPYSRFREAMSQDEEMADLLLELEAHRDEEEGEAPRLRYSQVGFKESLLISMDTTLKKILAEAPVISARANGNKSAKPKYPEPWPMPETAMERRRKVREKSMADSWAMRLGVPAEELSGDPAPPRKPAPKAPAEPDPKFEEVSRPGPIDPAMRRVWYASNLPK